MKIDLVIAVHIALIVIMEIGYIIYGFDIIGKIKKSRKEKNRNKKMVKIKKLKKLTKESNIIIKNKRA